MKLTPSRLARLSAAGRVVVGAAILADPGRAGRSWMGAAADTPGGVVALRAFGGRDVVVGLAQLHASRVGGRDAAAWALAGAFCDLVDGVSLLRERRELPPMGTVVVGVAGGAALAGVLFAVDALRAPQA